MYASKLRAAAIALGATLTLSACAGPYGGIGVGYGSGGYYGGYGNGGYYGGYGYDPYGYSPYGYSSYGYSPYGYSPYGGWYDDYYYPGSGYYVYSRNGSRHRWTDAQRRYWENHRRERTHDSNSLGSVVGREMVRQRESTRPTESVRQAEPVRRTRHVESGTTTVRSESTNSKRHPSTWRKRSRD